jgi:hypothetical protein
MLDPITIIREGFQPIEPIHTHELEQLLPWNWQAERVGTEPKVTA